MNEITEFAAAQWALILLDDELKERPEDLDACVRDLAECE
jgi:hypothetical protein